MRKTVTFILSIMITAPFLWGQSFYESHYELMDDVFSIEQTDDGGYIVGGNININSSLDTALICKFNSDGNLLWRKSYPVKNYRSTNKSVDILRDGSIVHNYTSDSLFIIKKFSADGNLIWQKEFNVGSSALISVGAEQTLYNTILAVVIDRQKHTTHTYALSSDGNLLTENEILFGGTNYKVGFAEINPDLFVLGTNSGLIGINSNGVKLWRDRIYSNLGTINVILPTKDGNIIAAGQGIYEISSNGELISETSISGFIIAGIRRNEELYFLKTYEQNEMLITNISHDTLKIIPLEFSPAAINLSKDIKIIIAGTLFKSVHLMQLNEDYKAIGIDKPDGGEKLSNTLKWEIEWDSFNVESADIDISTDGGISWYKVTENCTTNYDMSNVQLAYQPSTQCLIKITDSSDPNVYDISDSLFTIMFYQEYDYIAANQIKMWMGNNGMSSHNPIKDDAGFYWPGGENATIPAVFTDGILIGGKFEGEIRLHGTDYRTGLIPGDINPNGIPGDPLNPAHQLFKIKKEVPVSASETEKIKYEMLYNNWPVEKGAPWWDVNGDGKFTRYVDKPAMIGDEVLFYVANDLDSARTFNFSGSYPVGLEFQTTVFAFDEPALENAVFKKVKVINKSGKIFDDVYVGYFTDDDLGEPHDDYIGCDTSLSLGFTYNADNDDEPYYGIAPPAVGHLLIQGPKVPADQNDKAYYDNNWISGFQNLPMTAFAMHYTFMGYDNSPKSEIFYNRMQGKIHNGIDWVDPVTNDTTTFMFSGDPVNQTGWYEGVPEWDYSPGDRKYLMSSGPFTMAPGDTQEVVYAIYMARGTDNLNSLTKLKEKAPELVDYYFNEIPKLNTQNQNLFPNEFSISNNYPNPFNASTTIEFNLPVIEELGKTSLRTVVKVYDILGREVKTLLNKELLPGPHKIEFNGTGLASGVYLLRFEAEGRFQSIKKLMLLK